MAPVTQRNQHFLTPEQVRVRRFKFTFGRMALRDRFSSDERACSHDFLDGQCVRCFALASDFRVMP